MNRYLVLGILLAASLLGALPVAAAETESLPAELREDLDRLVEETARWRGLEAGSEIPAGIQDTPALRLRLESEIDQELPANVMAPLEAVLQRFGLIPAESDFRSMLLDLLAGQVAGYFDPESGEITLVEGDQGLLGGDFDEEVSEALTERMEESVLVHEIGHYLQHRHFDLERLLSGETLGDDVLARQALVEGDATLVMTSYLLDFAVERLPMFETLFREMVADPEVMLAASPDLPGTEELAAAPRYLRENLLFPYLQGMAFCVRVRQAGGQKLLDHAFRNDPPQSSEQILHPEKWLEERDAPIAVELPDLSAVWKGWDREIGGSWGELNTAIVLGVRGIDDDRARAAAAGWGGDSFALYRRGRKEAAVWITEWDSEDEAREFHDLAAEAFANWHVSATGRRVVLHDADLSNKKRRALEAALHGARAVRPDSPALDLVSLGITESDLPEPFGLEDSIALMDSTFFQELMQGLSQEEWTVVAQQLEDPDLQNEMEGMLRDMEPEEIDKLIENPAVQQLLEQVAAAETPTITRDGDVFGIVELGFRVTAPNASGWQMHDPQPDPQFGVPTPLATYAGEEGDAVALVAMVIKLPMPVPVRMLVPGIEVALPFEDRKKVSSADFDTPEGAEIEYTGVMKGQAVRLLQRLYAVDGFVLSIQALGPGALWEDIGESVRGFFDSITFDEVAN